VKTIKTETAERQQPHTPFGAPHAWVLVLFDSTDPHDVHRITQRETVFGRDGEVQVSLDDESVSKRHCSIQVDASICFVTDLDSLNGTMLNDRRLRPGVAQRLRHLDELRVGETRFLFLSGQMRQPARTCGKSSPSRFAGSGLVR
jgi:pSer/pThr/pTyr-binding forkhead associated (FHA) protein